jgi:phosphoglucomutase/phosphomannomutase
MEVEEVRDYQEHRITRKGGGTELLPEPSGDLMIFELSNPGCRFAVRPSGTEPKMKIYLFARTDTFGVSDPARLASLKAGTTAKLDQMTADLEKYMANALVEFGG